MTRPLHITANQVRAICQGARAAGCIAEIVIGDVVVRLVPEGVARHGSASGEAAPELEPEQAKTLEEYLAWRDRVHAAEARGNKP